MQLTKIKLAGFKSFVDPTVVPMPSNLVAIVGPNGCGKSNIIDAVCWVMGESSAKYLRGESLADVIFNGSTARKPVGQASVELIFDNQDGAIGGEYANYADISIRRVINREAESTYFLNGARCRRRDILDIFLGTGLGPRSYSIIGQNMISRIIEAKPEEMRIYLEEAAGISKYKERRRDTENRISHTKDNLARLDDVRTELDKQLATLQRQANAAEKFKQLKQEERVLRGQWLTAQWRQLDASLIQQTLQIQQQETHLEAKQADLSHLNLELDQQRESQRLAGEILQEVQGRYYETGSHIARLEQDIRHTQERYQQWQADLEQADKNWQEDKERLDEVKDELTHLSHDCERLSPALEQAQVTVAKQLHELETTEEAIQNWQTEWDDFNQQSASTTQAVQIEKTRMTHLEQRLGMMMQRQEKLVQEANQLNFSEIEQAIAVLMKKSAEVANVTSEQQERLAEVRQAMMTLRQRQQQNHHELDAVRGQVQRLSGQQASLEALQQTALGQRDHQVVQWLTQHKLDKLPRLAQGVEVEAGWEVAVEKVLGGYLQALCVDSLEDMLAIVSELQQGNLCVFSTSQPAAQGDKPTDSLLTKITSDWPLDSILAGIYTAETQEEALALSKQLSPQESVITRDGVWLNSIWMRIARENNPAAGVFQREQELKQLAKQLTGKIKAQKSLEQTVSEASETIKQLERESNELQKILSQSQSEAAQLQAQLKMQQEKLTEFKARAEKYQSEKKENALLIEQTQSELNKALVTYQAVSTDLEALTLQREALLQTKDQLRSKLHQQRESVDQAKESAHQLEIRFQSTKSQQSSLQQSMMRMETQLVTLAERKRVLQNDFQVGTPLDALQADLAVILDRRLQVENELNTARATIRSIEQDVQALETQKQLVERESAKVRDRLEALRLESQSIKVKSEHILEKLQDIHVQLEDILKELPTEACSEALHQLLDQVVQRITRLGAINLVAIEEYTACLERKAYLDQQYNDLIQGLTTLEDAIAKIDKETRARFSDMFDKVNDRFQELFPRVFGGGHASLILTDENLLSTGITVMACPPGKRNSTIHLLSGGEKAMTAIALIFSIFYLNPAPFCLLDEVDAPLDDANIGRFCQLVKSMSEKTQFIFISHNKLAIEMGQHLMGVTMQEPGVSRLVSVSIEEAVKLAEA